jgi:hypothetical protein
VIGPLRILTDKSLQDWRIVSGAVVKEIAGINFSPGISECITVRRTAFCGVTKRIERVVCLHCSGRICQTQRAACHIREETADAGRIGALTDFVDTAHSEFAVFVPIASCTALGPS